MGGGTDRDYHMELVLMFWVCTQMVFVDTWRCEKVGMDAGGCSLWLECVLLSLGEMDVGSPCVFVYVFACVFAASVDLTNVPTLGVGRVADDGGCVYDEVVLHLVFPGVVENGFFLVVAVT